MLPEQVRVSFFLLKYVKKKFVDKLQIELSELAVQCKSFQNFFSCYKHWNSVTVVPSSPFLFTTSFMKIILEFNLHCKRFNLFLCQIEKCTNEMLPLKKSANHFLHLFEPQSSSNLSLSIVPFNINTLNKLVERSSRLICTKMKSNGTEQEQCPTPFQSLASLPLPLQRAQCVIHKYEILICGSYRNNECYSYHTLKNQYKYICSYPDDVTLLGHNVIKIMNNSPSDIALLSFGGQGHNEKKHTLAMYYVSVWDETEIENKQKHYNQWLPYVDNYSNPICIGKIQGIYQGMRALIGGSNNNLLFITYAPKNIDIFDLTIFQYINQSILPVDNDLCYHCFVSRTVKSKLTNEKKKIEMLLFCRSTGLAIEYDEDNNEFQFRYLRVCTTMQSFKCYAYACIDDIILFFGGNNGNGHVIHSVHKYSITEDKWMKFEHTLPILLYHSVAILSEDSAYLHILGGENDRYRTTSVHLKTKVNEWKKKETEKEKQWILSEENEREMQHIENEKKLFALESSETKRGLQITKISIFLLEKNINTKLTKGLKQWLNIGFGYCPLTLDGLAICFGIFIFSFLNFLVFILLDVQQPKYFKLLRKFIGRPSGTTSVKFSPDGNKFVSSSFDKVVRIWDTQLGTEIQTLKGHLDWVLDAKFSPNGNMIVSSSSDKTIRLWDITTGSELKKLEGHLSSVTAAQFSPDGNIIVSASHDKTIRLWNAKSGKEIKKFEGHLHWVNDINFSPCGEKVVSSSNDNTIIIWNIKSGQKMQEFKVPNSNVFKVEFSPDGRSIASCSNDKIIRIWDVDAGRKLKEFKRNEYTIRDLKFCPDGQTIVSCSDNLVIQIWDVILGIEVQKLKAHSKIVTRIDVSSDGNTIVSCSADTTIALWRPL
ncbi:WD repeat-containing protein [Reticulomyxa filosa]|uniref:WD repeat-containing protein n=1 Tax=Reticulomyxa filosa TaxID=46433 RepID=X6LPQ9_RETFI|nr:WD repeat-containing protein [Reticulomyxa filosa]|eukprot:ETO03614.1 WD repeat-containing protein [Reticulomyxa filosa]